MLKRFIEYREVIENITIIHRSVIAGLTASVASQLTKLMLTDDDWKCLAAIRNVLSIFNQACNLVLRQHYPTASVGYVITSGLHFSLHKPSTGPYAEIENALKRWLFASFEKHFDSKLSSDQKQALVVSFTASPKMFHAEPRFLST